ncbi:MAG: hypothetical protein RMK18_03455 [Armatimonadota bacterium]|nr:hypothetical protein [Armatimonadota bacterium]MCX7777025.1 hypothetical protein [Armatimonadota bacterium]MDW8024907.1 hypothetical protein [Armatimonadota bacterium]
MVALKCPRCGTVTYEGHFSFPKCHICHEDLTKCRYCRHYQGDGKACGALAGKPIIYGDDVRQCGSYQSKLKVAVSPSQFSTKSNVAACILTSAMMGIIVAVLSMLPHTNHDHTETIAVRCRRNVRQSDILVTTLTIPRRLRTSSANISLLIPKGVLNSFSLLSISPTPTFRMENEQRIVYSYRGLMPTMEPFTVRLTLRPLKNGIHSLRFEVIEEDEYGNLARREVLTWNINVMGDDSGKKTIKQHLFIIALSGSMMPCNASIK